MSILHIQQISNQIKTLFADKIDMSDAEGNEDKLLSRCLAAYAIYHFSECTEEEAAQSVTDGYKDNGIDAIYYSNRLNKLFVVQAKYSKKGQGEPDKGDLLKFYQGLKDLFSYDSEKLTRFNEKIQKKSQLIDKALSEYGCKYQIILIDTYEKNEINEENIRSLNEYISEINESGDSSVDQIASFERMNQGKIYTSLLMNANGNSIDLELALNDWGAVSEPYKAYYGRISVSEIAEWWDRYGDSLFRSNIRKVLGRTDVNAEIEKTLSEEPASFWYFNNGITLIADKIQKTALGGSSRNIGTFKLTNASVVNGAQTVSSIGTIKSSINPDEFNQAEVMIRIIEVSHGSELEQSITKANNRQNRVEGMDFASQDPEQKRIKSELVLESIDYNLTRSDNFSPSDNAFDLQEATIAMASINRNINLSVQVKNAIGRFFEDLERGIYKEIFNSNINGYQVWNSVRLVREINKLLKLKIDNLDKKGGRMYGIYVQGNRIIAHIVARKLGIYDDLNKNNLVLDSENINSYLDEAIADVSEFIEEKYPDKFLASLFKNMTKCKELESYLLSKGKIS